MSRLKTYLEAITSLLKGEAPVRVMKTGWVENEIGDASGDDFEAALFVKGALLFR